MNIFPVRLLPFFTRLAPHKWRWLWGLALLAVACQPYTSPPVSLPFTTIDKEDTKYEGPPTYSAKEPAIFLINQASEISQVSDWLNSKGVEGLQALDYSQWFAIVVFQGDFASGWEDYHAEITQVDLADDFLTVTAVFEVPLPGQVIKTAGTTPYHVIAVPRPEKNTGFEGAHLVVQEQVVASYPRVLTPTPLPTGTPEPSLMDVLPQPPFSDAALAAQLFIATKYQLPLEELKIDADRPEDYGERGLFQFVVLFYESADFQEFRHFQVLVNPNTYEVIEDIHAFQTKIIIEEQAAYGKLDASLYDHLQTISDDTPVTVAIWFKIGEAQTQSAREKTALDMVTQKYPEAQAALTAYGSPFSIDTEALREAVFADYLAFLKINQFDAAQAPLVLELQAQGYDVTLFEGLPSVVVTLPKSVVVGLNTHPDINLIYLAEGEVKAEMDDVIPNNMVPAVWLRGYDGSGVRVAVLENGNVDLTNGFLHHLAPRLEIPGGGLRHMTFVASIVGSSYDPYRGMAFNAGIMSVGVDVNPGNYVWGLRWVTTDLPPNEQADVVNVSAGLEDQTTRRLQWFDRAFDWYARASNRLIVKSAGNVGGNISPPGRGWNVLTVGSYLNNNDANWFNDTMHPESDYMNPCGSPTSETECYEKPEVVGVGGNNVFALGDDGHIVALTNAGTSAAAPQVSGLAALLIDRSPVLVSEPLALKAIIMASATHNVDGLSYIYWNSTIDLKDGAGAIRADSADDIAQYHGSTTGTCLVSCWWSMNIANTSPIYRQFWAEAGDHVRVVLTWWSHPDSEANNFSFDRLDTDLNLYILAPTGHIIQYSISQYNNFEMVDFYLPQTGVYKIRLDNVRFEEGSNRVGLAFLKEAAGPTAVTLHQAQATKPPSSIFAFILVMGLLEALWLISKHHA